MKICVVSTKDFSYPAGGQAVAVHILDILKKEHEVAFVNFNVKIDWDRVNSFYGTYMKKGEIREINIGWPFRLNNNKFWFIKKNLAMRYCKNNYDNYDLFFSTSGELDFGKKGIQWINHPIPQIFNKKSSTYFGWLNDLVCKLITNTSVETMKKNFTLANSLWTSKKIKDIYGINSTVVYPPIKEFDNFEFPDFSDWQKREKGFVVVGRISRDKKIHKIIEIMDKVVLVEENVKLFIVGSVRDQYYFDELKALAATRPWIIFNIGVDREKLEDIIKKNKFGIHAKPDERFGMGVAEMVYGGLLTFVPNGGGQVEIVNNANDLVYSSSVDAVDKIIKLINDVELQSKIFLNLKEHRLNFTRESFRHSIMSVVDLFGL